MYICIIMYICISYAQNIWFPEILAFFSLPESPRPTCQVSLSRRFMLGAPATRESSRRRCGMQAGPRARVNGPTEGFPQIWHVVMGAPQYLDGLEYFRMDSVKNQGMI